MDNLKQAVFRNQVQAETSAVQNTDNVVTLNEANQPSTNTTIQAETIAVQSPNGVSNEANQPSTSALGLSFDGEWANEQIRKMVESGEIPELTKQMVMDLE